MTANPKILMAMGTRPEIIKMAPIYYELKAEGVTPLLLHTGQHDELAMPQYEFFDMKPDYLIDLKRNSLSEASNSHHPGHSLSLLSSVLLREISNTIADTDPSIVLVHGDTSSAFMAAMAAFYQQKPIAHIEAGLRSHHEYNPFPEEMNRILISRLARWHFAPTFRAKANLIAEGIDENKIHVVGNTIVEATSLGINKLPHYLNHHDSKESVLLDAIIKQNGDKKIIMVTLHRRENQASNLLQIISAIKEILKKYDDILIVWPIHPNPKIRAAINGEIGDLNSATAARLHLIRPLSYPLFLSVMQHAWMVLTDSGGVQEEAVALQIPVLILRDTTERPEVIEAGIGILARTEKGSILQHVASFYRNPAKREAWSQMDNPFGNGTAAKTICATLLSGTASSAPDVRSISND